MTVDHAHPYDALTPDTVLDAVEAAGFLTNASLLALNSYENRVYRVGLDEGGSLVAKFYRPGRWSRAQIAQEHAYSLALNAHEVPVVAPMANDNGDTVFEHAGFLLALFPNRPGRWPELDNANNLEWLGRFLGRMHAVGATMTLPARPVLSAEQGWQAREFLLSGQWVAPHMERRYADVTEQVLKETEARFAQMGGRVQPIHGDCHPGNILWTEMGPHFVDLDDCVTGPVIQDLWMLLSGTRQDMSIQMGDLLEGYEMFADFDRRQLALIEPLRALRPIHYAGWLARRWDDPAFSQAFPWFGEPRYWEEQVSALEEQAAALDDPPLSV